MRNLTNAAQKIVRSGDCIYHKYAKFTLLDEQIVEVDESAMWSNGLKLEDAVSSTSSFDIGSAIINKLTISLNNIDGDYEDYIFEGARVYASIGIDVTADDGTVTTETIPLFFGTVIDEPQQNASIITLTCEDDMYKLDQDYSKSTLSYEGGASAMEIIEDACITCSVSYDISDLESMSGAYIRVNERPADDALTCRQVLAWACQIVGCFARFDPNGKMRFRAFDPTIPYVIDDELADSDGTEILDSADDTIGTEHTVYLPENVCAAGCLFSLTTNRSEVSITGVRVTEYLEATGEEDAAKIWRQTVDDAAPVDITTENAESSGYELSISDNRLITAYNAEEVCNNLGNKLNGLSFRPYSASITSNVEIEAGDSIQITNRKGETITSFVTYTTFQPGAQQTISCGAEAAARNATVQYTLTAQALIDNKNSIIEERTSREQAIDNLQTTVANATGMYLTTELQEDGSNIYYLHDKATKEESENVMSITSDAIAFSDNGGETWVAGITFDGAMIMSTIETYKLSADYIQGGVLKLGGVDNVDGTLEVYDADGNRTVLLDNTGATIYADLVVEVGQTARFGNFAFVPRSDGSLQFLKVQ